MSDVISSDLSFDEKNSWSTPHWLFNAINKMYKFSLDVAASEINHKCDNYFTADDDALNKNWFEFTSGNDSAWCNPPYSRGMIKKFIDKAQEQRFCGVTSVFLVPATPDASWFPDNASEVWFITGGRIGFVNPVTGKTINGNTKGSMIIILKPFHFETVTRFVNRSDLKASIEHE